MRAPRVHLCKASLPWSKVPCSNPAEVRLDGVGCCYECVGAITDGRWFQVIGRNGLPKLKGGLPEVEDEAQVAQGENWCEHAPDYCESD